MPISKARATIKKKVNAGWKNIEGKGFKPGQSGNPGGRPKKIVTRISDALNEELAKAVSDKDLRTWAQVIAQRMVKEAALTKGGLFAYLAKEIADRTEGKPKQQVEVKDTTDRFSGWTKEQLAEYAAKGKEPDVPR